VPAAPIALVLDGSGSHTSQHIHWPTGLQPVPLPRYSPELRHGFQNLAGLELAGAAFGGRVGTS
jgi:hypothetical protein